MTPENFYKNYSADDNMSDLSFKLYELITELKPMHIFEFGMGSGKNLVAFDMQKIVTCGLDISPMNVIRANVKNELPFVIIGNQYHLGHLANFDVAFTCSVLDHIEDIDQIIIDLKRIAKTVFLAETNDVPSKFYFPHNYESYGFTKIDFEWTGQDNAKYFIWKS
jgi:2-polyprenyl-3-methyl-5-hydroxy-6-metoxy-1,4-benzoquinol methylase